MIKIVRRALLPMVRAPKWKGVVNFSTNKYRGKTSKQIDKQIIQMRWKNLQNSFKAIDSSFGLKVPESKQLENQSYASPSTFVYSIQSLRECSKKYPVYLYWELERKNSPFHETIKGIMENLWKIDKKEMFQILQFLFTWKYQRIDILQLYERAIYKFDLTMSQIFSLFKLLQFELQTHLQNKILSNIRSEQIFPQDYAPLLKILNMLTVKGKLKEDFYIAITAAIEKDINTITPSDVIPIYIYYTYNAELQTEFQTRSQEQNKKLPKEILLIVEKRIFDCLNFLKGEELVAFTHTYYKNLISVGRQNGEQELKKITNRIQLMFVSEELQVEDKAKLLLISAQFPFEKRSLIIAYLHKQLYKKEAKFAPQLLTQLYLATFQTNMLTQNFISQTQKLILDNILSLSSHDVSRASWLFTVGGGQKAEITNKQLHGKLIEIIEGGLRGYEIKDISMIVWSMGMWNIRKEGRYWQNIEYYIEQEINRNREKENILNEVSWVLWAYTNNYPLSLKTINLISQIILQKYKKDYLLPILNVFQLINITTFYYCLNFPPEMKPLVQQISEFCLLEFKKQYNNMQIIEICKIVKYMGYLVWKDKPVTLGIIKILEENINTIEYRDLMVVIGLLVSSPLKGGRVEKLVGLLMKRKKELESVEKAQG